MPECRSKWYQYIIAGEIRAKQQKNKAYTNLEKFVLREGLVDKNGCQH